MSNRQTFLVTGGAGYIGSQMAKELASTGSKVVVLDNLALGNRWAARFGELVEVDLKVSADVQQVFSRFQFDAVFHFAAASSIPESVTNPEHYTQENVLATKNLLEAMSYHNVKRLLFSSTCAVYGNFDGGAVSENNPCVPDNPYRQSKRLAEELISKHVANDGLNGVIFRYFNACGADPDGDLGELRKNETHLVPTLLKVASGRLKAATIYGTDYDTPDGTAIRDYLHVWDICEAHRLALHRLFDGSLSRLSIFNLGTGIGRFVFEVVASVNRVIARERSPITLKFGPKRSGDAQCLIADPKKSSETLGWKPRYINLDGIIDHAWNWEKFCKINHPATYR